MSWTHHVCARGWLFESSSYLIFFLNSSIIQCQDKWVLVVLSNLLITLVFKSVTVATDLFVVDGISQTSQIWVWYSHKLEVWVWLVNILFFQTSLNGNTKSLWSQCFFFFWGSPLHHLHNVNLIASNDDADFQLPAAEKSARLVLKANITERTFVSSSCFPHRYVTTAPDFSVHHVTIKPQHVPFRSEGSRNLWDERAQQGNLDD